MGHLRISQLELTEIETLQFSLHVTLYVYFLTAPLLRSHFNDIVDLFYKRLLNKTQNTWLSQECLWVFCLFVFLRNFRGKWFYSYSTAFKVLWGKVGWKLIIFLMWNATPFFTKLLFKASLNQFVLKMPDFKYMLCFFETCWIGGPKLRFLRIDGCAYPFSSNLHPEISAILSSIFLNLRNQVGSAEVASERIAYADCISDCAFTHQKFRLVEIRST